MSIEMLELAGDAYARGRQFGVARSRQIQDYLSDWLQSLRAAGIGDPQAYIAAMLRDTDYLTAIREHTPDLLDEVLGIVAGVGKPHGLLLATQLMDEEWAYRPSPNQHAEATQKCSSIAINSRERLTLIGQNMDLGQYTDGHQLVLRIAPAYPEVGALVFTIGGMIGLLGVNARGVAVCVNSLPQLPTARKGLPVAFVVRKLLQAQSMAAAVAMVRDLPHATGQHYLIADSSSIRSFEASPAGVIEYRAPDPSRVLHTNHPLAAEARVDVVTGLQANTEARLHSLTQRLSAGEPDLSAIKAALSSCDDPIHPVCRRRVDNGNTNSATSTICFTTVSMISVLEQHSETIPSWISAGPPTPGRYTQIELLVSR